jgi:hypothetical protein
MPLRPPYRTDFELATERAGERQLAQLIARALARWQGEREPRNPHRDAADWIVERATLLRIGPFRIVR